MGVDHERVYRSLSLFQVTLHYIKYSIGYKLLDNLVAHLVS